MAKGGFPRGMGGMGGNMNQMIKQAQKMQEQLAKMQEDMENQIIEASSGGGVVTVVVNGKKELQSVKINPEAVDPDDVEMLEDLICAAVNEAMRKADEKSNAEMSKITGGMNLPF